MVNGTKTNPSTHRVNSRITTMHWSSDDPFFSSYLKAIFSSYPFAFRRKPAFFSNGGSILGYLPSSYQKLPRKSKSPTLVRNLRNQDVGHGAGVKMPKTTVNCSYCFALGTEYYLVPVTEGWRNKLHLHSNYKGLNKGKLQWLLPLASPDHCTPHWLEN